MWCLPGLYCLEQCYYSFSPTIASASSSSPHCALPIKLEHGQGHKATLGHWLPNWLDHGICRYHFWTLLFNWRNAEPSIFVQLQYSLCNDQRIKLDEWRMYKEQIMANWPCWKWTGSKDRYTLTFSLVGVEKIFDLGYNFLNIMFLNKNFAWWWDCS